MHYYLFITSFQCGVLQTTDGMDTINSQFEYHAIKTFESITQVVMYVKLNDLRNIGYDQFYKK